MKGTTSTTTAVGGRSAQRLAELELAGAIPFVLVHLATLGAIWSGIDVTALVVCCVG